MNWFKGCIEDKAINPQINVQQMKLMYKWQSDLEQDSDNDMYGVQSIPL